MGGDLFSLEEGLRNIKEWIVVGVTIGIFAVESEVFPVFELPWWAFLGILVVNLVLAAVVVNLPIKAIKAVAT